MYYWLADLQMAGCHLRFVEAFLLQFCHTQHIQQSLCIWLIRYFMLISYRTMVAMGIVCRLLVFACKLRTFLPVWICPWCCPFCPSSERCTSCWVECWPVSLPPVKIPLACHHSKQTQIIGYVNRASLISVSPSISPRPRLLFLSQCFFLSPPSLSLAFSFFLSLIPL